MERMVIHADLGGQGPLGFARLLEISLQRTQQLIGANYIFFWQSIPLLPAAAQKLYISQDHIEACA